MKNNTNYSCLTIWKMLCVDTIFKMAAVVGLLLLQIGLFGQNKWCSMGENAFHMVFQERWVFSHSSPNPALAATRLWAGYGELVGENSIYTIYAKHDIKFNIVSGPHTKSPKKVPCGKLHFLALNIPTQTTFCLTRLP